MDIITRKKALANLQHHPGIIGQIASKLINDPYWVDDFDWYIFIMDHFKYIRNKSDIAIPSNIVKSHYSQELKRYCRDSGLPLSFYPIFLAINQLAPIDNLYYKNKIFLINEEVIKDLYTKYKNIISQKLPT